MNSKTIDLVEATRILDAYENGHQNADLVEAKNALNRTEGISTSIIYVKGPVQTASLDIDSSTLLIDGDLEVSEMIQDCQNVDSSLFIVLGNVTCQNLITLSAMYITGNLKVISVILGDSRCDHSLVVGGDIDSPTILDYGHDVRAGGSIRSSDIHVFNGVEDRNGGVENNLKVEEMADEIVTEDNGENLPDLQKTIQFIKSGGKIFRKFK